MKYLLTLLFLTPIYCITESVAVYQLHHKIKNSIRHTRVLRLEATPAEPVSIIGRISHGRSSNMNVATSSARPTPTASQSMSTVLRCSPALAPFPHVSTTSPNSSPQKTS
ncbi:hypothetical protein DSO57_1005935 [Entomophthora muscae]|uniref:Uncharacterized protein n=1 Tax=Entomophthora muscae TaxID=34485 RepID=A0ACC2RYT3_9FUNG|nr:hypothetical protein DSO57_1005935 [Entomophthora muscae]